MKGKLVPLRRIEGAPVEMSDDALLAAAAGGDPAALGALFDRHGAALHRFMRRLVNVHSVDEIDDLVQATFEAVATATRRERATASARAWLFGVAHNIARHHNRTARRRGRLASRLELEPAPPAPSPHAEVATRHEVARVGEAVAKLPDNLRSAFVLCYLEGMSGAEAAEALHVREGTVWKRLHQARKALRLALSEGEADEA